ncbi:MAG TPA: hypothetical protein V6D09_05485 [Leptolyngbyaceae cyanobacterium]
MWQKFLYSTILTFGLLPIFNPVIAQTNPEQQPTTPKQSPVLKPPIPGESCQAETTLNGDRILYRTSYINSQNLSFDGKPVEVDMLKNDTIVAHALTRYAGEFTFTGETGTKTPISIQLKPDRNEIKITHAGKIVLGKCGEVM